MKVTPTELPEVLLVEPVYAPRCEPKSRLSASAAGIVAQFTATNAPPRPLAW